MMKEDACATQIVCGSGEFNVAALDSFVKKVKFDRCGSSYAVVAIIGPQGSGKSTLMNHLFRTGFEEMKIECGQSQTTKGIWIAKCVGIEFEPCTIALDLEGSGSRERGEDDTTFEKQIALFALAVSDILLINMWYNDAGREQASGKPLLKTIFQVMMRLYGDPPKKTTLILVVRDKPSKAPFELLEKRLRDDMEKMWVEVLKPEAHKESPLTLFFNVQVVALSNYLEKEETFKEEVAQLRQRFVNSISPGGLVGDGQRFVPASGFSLSTRKVWEEIKPNKDLDLPAHKHAQDVYATMLPHLCSKALVRFKLGLEQSLQEGGQLFDSSVRTCAESSMNEFNQGCADAPLPLADDDISSIRKDLHANMDDHASSVSRAKQSELSAHWKEQVYASLTKEIEHCVTNGGKDVWASIRNLATRTEKDGISKLSTATVDFGFALDKDKNSEIETDIRDWTRYSVVKIVRDEADKVLIRMNKRFSIDFTYDGNLKTRRWTKKKQITSVTKDAHSTALMLLSDMAVIRLDNKRNNVKEVLFSHLLDGVVDSKKPFPPDNWEGVSSEDTILTPKKCKNLWEDFLVDIASLVRDATSDVNAHKRHKREMAITAIGTAATVASLGVALIGLPPVFLAALL